MKHTKSVIAAAGTCVAAVAIGIGVAVAQPNEGETPITGDAYTKATQVALAYTGGGKVTQTHLHDEEGFYQVEVTMPDGSQTDVNMDEKFHITGSKTEPAGADDTQDAPGSGD
jgi:hypothetical protein